MFSVRWMLCVHMWEMHGADRVVHVVSALVNSGWVALIGKSSKILVPWKLFLLVRPLFCCGVFFLKKWFLEREVLHDALAGSVSMTEGESIGPELLSPLQCRWWGKNGHDCLLLREEAHIAVGSHHCPCPLTMHKEWPLVLSIFTYPALHQKISSTILSLFIIWLFLSKGSCLLLSSLLLCLDFLSCWCGVRRLIALEGFWFLRWVFTFNQRTTVMLVGFHRLVMFHFLFSLPYIHSPMDHVKSHELLVWLL